MNLRSTTYVETSGEFPEVSRRISRIDPGSDPAVIVSQELRDFVHAMPILSQPDRCRVTEHVCRDIGATDRGARCFQSFLDGLYRGAGPFDHMVAERCTSRGGQGKEKSIIHRDRRAALPACSVVRIPELNGSALSTQIAGDRPGEVA